MTTIKTYTDLEQSKKLAEILPIESVDMYYAYYHNPVSGASYYEEYPMFYKPICNPNESVPCWSLATLLEQLPYELCDDDGNSVYLQMNKEEDLYQLMYGDTDPYAIFESIETDRYEHFVDACYEMILKLHELKML